MGLDMNTSLSIALSFTGSYKGPPVPLLRTSSLCQDQPGSIIHSHSSMAFSCWRGSRGEISLYKGVSDRPLGWKPRRTKLELNQYSSSTNPKRWDGLAGTKTDWDGLRRVNLHPILIDW
jgi:hypothetical protein